MPPFRFLVISSGLDATLRLYVPETDFIEKGSSKAGTLALKSKMQAYA